jgi:hypothetical protein
MYHLMHNPCLGERDAARPGALPLRLTVQSQPNQGVQATGVTLALHPSA